MVYIIELELLKICSYYGYMKNTRNGRKYISREGRLYKEKIEDVLNAYMEDKIMLISNVKVEIDIYFNNKRKNDLDNFVKPLLDFMSEIVYVDDKQITDLHIKKYYRAGKKFKIIFRINNIEDI
jgi:crossover junction endodeoxyribonuclease RusA